MRFKSSEEAKTSFCPINSYSMFYSGEDCALFTLWDDEECGCSQCPWQTDTHTMGQELRSLSSIELANWLSKNDFKGKNPEDIIRWLNQDKNSTYELTLKSLETECNMLTTMNQILKKENTWRIYSPDTIDKDLSDLAYNYYEVAVLQSNKSISTSLIRKEDLINSLHNIYVDGYDSQFKTTLWRPLSLDTNFKSLFSNN